MTRRFPIAIVWLLVSASLAWSRQTPGAAPEVFEASVKATGPVGVAMSNIRIQINRFSTDRDRDLMLRGLQQNGYPGFLPVLRNSPIVGQISAGDQKWNIRWARATDGPKGRSYVLATDQPMYFVGRGMPNAKSTAGYGLAVVQFDIDANGRGSGTMAGAARVKPGGSTGIQIDDYADKPIELVSVVRALK